MYIQITTRCNMTCEHCCYACTEKGEDMTPKVWEAALDLAIDYGESVSIGGGEPTIHPDFWRFLGEAIGSGAEYVWLATNGSQTRTALALAGMAKAGVIGCALSQDSYHDAIDGEVIQAFTRDAPKHGGYDNRTPDAREVRNVEGEETNAGRCDFGADGDCVCSDFLIEPIGTIRGCGCKDAPTFGTVFDPQIPEDWNHGECHKDQEEY